MVYIRTNQYYNFICNTLIYLIILHLVMDIPYNKGILYYSLDNFSSEVNSSSHSY